MTNQLKLALPVMLHDDTEVNAFKQAKPRIERYLAAQGIPARGVMLDLPTLAQRKVLTGVILAQLMEQAAFRAEVA